MRPGLVWTLFRRSAHIQRKRMAMTVAAIAWGTISIVLLLSFGEGMKRNFEKNRKGLGDSIVIVWAGQTSKPFAGFPQGRRFQFRPDDVVLLRQTLPELESAVGEMRRWGTPITYGRTTLNKPVIGTEPDYGDLRSHYAQAGGRFLNDEDERLKRRVIFLGDKAAQEIFKQEDPIGRTVLVNQVPFTVVGVMKKKTQMGMYGGPDDNHTVIPLSTFRALFGQERLSNFVFKADRPEETEAVKKRVYEVLGGKYRFDPTDERALSIWDTLEGMRVMNNITLGIELFLGFIGALTLLIGGVGVANIMYAVVKHRTKEIGVQMALGAKRYYVLSPLVVESLALTTIGGAIGVAVGAGAVQLLGFLQRKSDSEALQFLGAPTLSWPIAATTILLLGTIGFLAGYFPARRALQVQPAVALRYE